MAMNTQTTRRRRTLQQVTSYVNPRLGIKDRMRAIRAVDHRQTESRIIEDALLFYMPMLEQRLMPMLEKRLQPMQDTTETIARGGLSGRPDGGAQVEGESVEEE